MSRDSATTSDVERIKSGSRQLRGTLAASLDDPLTGALAEDDTQLSKFHGIYQQDDRDLRSERRRQRLEPAYSFMIRARVPAGRCTPLQWLALDAIATTYANGTLRLTTRQAFQLHGVIKRSLRPTLKAINASLLDTLAACGDVNRNVMAGATPWRSAVHREVDGHAAGLSAHLTPRTGAYHEIWLDGEQLASTREESEPIYGATYLPRKFKVAFAIPPDNDVDVYAQDLGFIAVVEDGRLAGFNVAVGGGMGMSHGEPATYPRLASVIGRCAPSEVLAVAEAVVTTQRDYGDRSDRRHARLKYTIDKRGLDWFRGEVERRAGLQLSAAAPVRFTGTGDRYGWVRGEDGVWHYTVFVENGRVADAPGRRLMSFLRDVARRHDGEFLLTPNQNVIVSRVADGARPAIDALIAEHAIDEPAGVSALRRHALACVGLPTCGLAMAESERYMPEFVSRLEALAARHGLADTPIVTRMTGCPNGCARPYVAEIGLVGKAPGRYNLYLGAGFVGDRLNKQYLENADEAAILEALDPLFAAYAASRTDGEAFGDFVVRTGVVRPAREGRSFHDDIL